MRAKFGQCEDSDPTWGWNFLPLHRFDGVEGRDGKTATPPCTHSPHPRTEGGAKPSPCHRQREWLLLKRIAVKS
jgi:hypothetical protein